MELKWLEDFVSLAETRSFSRSAELRHITQPAFSRRIQALEAWLGTELIDRSVYPTRLTQAGQVLGTVQAAFLTAAFETIKAGYGSLDNYLRDGLGIGAAEREALRERYLES